MAHRNDLTRRLPFSRKKMKPRRVRALIHAGIIVLLVGLIAFSVYQVARHMTVKLNTLRTQEIVDESYVSLRLYVFRDEQVLLAEGSNTNLYRVRDGEKVKVGQSLGTAYAVSDPVMATALQSQLDTYAERIALYREIKGLGTPADARAEAEAVDRNYMGLLDASDRGDLSAIYGLSDRMLDGLGRYDILTGVGDGATVATLEAERDALVAGQSPVAQIRSDRSGYFYYEADGYESIFPYASAMTMTPAEFRDMAARPAVSVPAGVVGKMVFSARWYAAAYIPLSDPAIELFQQGIRTGAAYTMLCGDNAGTEITMTIERLEVDEGGALVVFSGQDMPEGFSFDRSFRAETVALRVSGYRIPNEALVTLRSDQTGKDVAGVYILTGNVVEFRKIRIHARRDGYIIAETYEDVQALIEAATDEQRDALTADGWNYLNFNDNIITGNELYEGKVIS